MKRIVSIIMCALLVFAGVPVFAVSAAPLPADAALPVDEEFALYPAEMTLPLYSESFGERLWVFWDGMLMPANLFSWSSSDTGVLTVDQNGFITPVAPGVATVTVYDEDMSAECTVTVVEDELFTTIADLEYTDLIMPFYSEEVGIGPLGGGTPVILKRFIRQPGCGEDDPPDPNAYIPSEGWVYTYAVIYRFYARYGDSFVFSTGPSGGADAAQNAYVCIYDQFFNLWSYSKGTTANPFGEVTLTSYEDSYFYVVITPISHTAAGGNGSVRFYAYNTKQPYEMGDADLDHRVSALDALLVMRACLGLVEVTDEQVALGDVNANSSLDANDALMLLRYTLGLTPLSPTEH